WDVLLGCGVLYFIFFFALGLSGPAIKGTFSVGGLAVLAIVTGAPHYGATLLRVYDQRASRRRYALLAVWFSAGLVLLFGASLYWYSLGIFMISLYFNWNPWHYSGQNYGLAMMFLRRRAIAVNRLTQNLFYASFVLSALLAVVAMNGPRPEGPISDAKVIGPLYYFEPIGLSNAWSTGLLSIGLALYGSCLVGAVISLLRRSTFSDILPALLLAGTQALWFVIPLVMRHWEIAQGFLPFNVEQSEYVFLFIAAGHSIQYLWVTSYFARRTDQYPGNFRYWLRCVLAGSALWNVPPIILAALAVGVVAYTEGLALLVAAVINLHHFVLDGAIWKLREGPVARVLLRDSSQGDGLPIESRSDRHLGRIFVSLVGSVGVSIALLSWWENEFGFVYASRRGDEVRMQLAAERLEMIGRPQGNYRRHLAQVALARGNQAEALEQLDKSLEVRQHPKSHFAKGHVLRSQGRWEEAAAAYQSAYEIDPQPVKLIYRLSEALIHAKKFDRASAVLHD
ncbi:tetratricopeptide repeat protein, partial [Myxococcota bacterium]|nr:tetratricopeptide repeat protein [Myxococcota bacterium]